MEQKSKFDKVMGAWDILVIAFGAMIGWGWVINSGDWITTAGFAGSIIAMLIGGLMVFFVGLTYAELTSAMPPVRWRACIQLQGHGTYRIFCMYLDDHSGICGYFRI